VSPFGAAGRTWLRHQAHAKFSPQLPCASRNGLSEFPIRTIGKSDSPKLPFHLNLHMLRLFA